MDGPEVFTKWLGESEEAIRHTAARFADLATIAVERSGDQIVVALSEFSGSATELRDQFANHALHQTIILTRRAVEEAEGT